jgi:putative endonuclease
MAASYYLYVLSSDPGVLYLGVTNDLHRRLEEHRRAPLGAFSKRYRTTRPVYFEETRDIRSAIAREKQLKGWRRSKKLSLIRSTNPEFHDLSEESWGSSAGAQGPADDKKDSSALCAFAEHTLGRSDMRASAFPLSFLGAAERRRHLHRTSRKDTGTVCGAPHTCPPEGHRDDVARSASAVPGGAGGNPRSASRGNELSLDEATRGLLDPPGLRGAPCGAE